MKKIFILPIIFFATHCDDPVTPDKITPAQQTLFINEFMASNTVTIVDNKGEYDDWVEIYNAGDSLYSLANHYLTDNLSDKAKWKFPNIQVAAKSFYIVWCDSDTSQGANHTNFKLSASGEQLAIFNSSGSLIDSLTFGAQKSDTSFGRFPDGSNAWKLMPQPTPGTANK